MKLTRREFASFSAGLPFLGAVAVARDPDVVVVGAGAAGLAAAQVLVNAGKNVQLVEAAARIGGRCFTDTTAFGWTFDRGASWLRNGNQNPLYGFAKLFRFQTSTAPGRETLYAAGRMVSPDANAAFERAYDAVSLALGEAADAESDVAASVVVPPELDALARVWLGAAAAQIGPLDMGVDFESLSVKDWFMREDAEPRVGVREGVGTLVARLADGLPVSVNTRVRAIKSAPGGRIAVETSRGTIETQAVIVTASVGALVAGGIRFEPGIGPDLQRGLDGMQMGHIAKIALSFAAGSPALRFAQNAMLVPQLADQRGAAFFARPFGAPMVICETGGSLALELEQQSEKAQLDFARGQLKALMGSKADQGFRTGAATDWGRNPLFRGAFASAKPGSLQARDLLATPIQERVFLAGEALAAKAAQTVHGAYSSGQATARRVISLLNRKRRGSI